MQFKNSSSYSRPKVLMVDDREDNLLAYEVALRDVGCDLVKALSGRAALEQVASAEFAAVLLDVQMPEMDGFETASRIRTLPNGKLLPILFITAGMHDNAMLKKAHGAGAIDFLAKPIDSEILISKLQQFIELYQARQIIRSQVESRNFLKGEGETPKLILDHEWSKTSLGHLNEWPQSLRTAVGIMLQSRFPMFISWGPERVFLYNDGYSEILGEKHPKALGRKFQDVWSEIWADVGPLVHQVEQGQSVYLEDMKLKLNRFQYSEDAFFTFSYSPLRGEHGQVEGLFCSVVETTKRKKSEANLKIALQNVEKSEKTLDQIFNESPAFMALVQGPEHRFVRANRKYSEVTGRSDVVGKTVAEVFPEIEDQGFIQILDEVYRTGKPYYGLELPMILMKDEKRTEVFFTFVYQPLLDASGAIYGIVGQGNDVTYQVQARRKIEDSDRELRLALESARMGTWRIDLKTKHVAVSNQLAELLQVPQDSLDLFSIIKDRFHVDDREGTETRLRYAMENKSAYVDEYRAVGPSGETRWFSSRGNVIHNASGEAVSMSGVTLDITDRKLGQLALERNARLVETMPQPFFAVDANWILNYWNPAATEVLGIEKSEVIGRSLWDVFPDLSDSIFGERYRRTFEHQVRETFEAFYPGFQKWFHASSFPFEDGIAVAFLDITAQKHTEKVLADAKREAEKASALKSAFLANMSHEIRTPLGAMIGFADLLKDPSLEETERGGYIDIITRNGNQLALLINDILDLSKVESGHLAFETQSLDIESLVNEVVSLLNINAREKKLFLQVEFAASTPKTLMTDPTRLKQVLLNVIGNAIKFTHIGGVSVRTYSFQNENQDWFVGFEVTDTGIGVPEEKRGKLFQVFSQADESITRKYGGTGLGLALSKKLANALGGDISLAQSAEGRGSTFLVTLKNQEASSAKTVPAELPVENADLQKSAEGYLEGLKVLLVEDSPDNQMLIWHILAKRGAKIEIAENGLEGVSMALTGAYDLVLMDIQMPLMDGYTATLRLREQGFAKPIIALTAHAMSEIRQKCLQVGCSDHLPKPINANDLVTLVSKYAAVSIS